MKKNKKGVSLIILLITIIVLLIISGVVINNLKGHLEIHKIEQLASRADIRAYREELENYVMTELSRNEDLDKEDIYESNPENLSKYIPSIKEEHKKIFIISKGELLRRPFVNPPKLVGGMIPIKFNGNNWQICSETDLEWYDYVTPNRKWANVMLSDGTYKDKTKIGQVVEDKDLGSMFVWIPRFSYSVVKYKTRTNKYEGELDGFPIFSVSFLLKDTNIDERNKEYPKSYNVEECVAGQRTSKIVHPGFNYAGKERTGFWISKFEPGKREERLESFTPNIKVKPYARIEYKIGFSKKMLAQDNIYKLNSNEVYLHIARPSEFCAVTYLAGSQYGIVPTENYVGDENFLTGGGDYRKNITQSTTENVTGIYDLNGGRPEYTAGYYDVQNDMIINEMKSEPQNFDVYKVAEEEKNDNTYNRYTSKNIEEIKKLAKQRFELNRDKFGDGIYELTMDGSYYVHNGNKQEEFEKAEMMPNLCNNDSLYLGLNREPYICYGGKNSDRQSSKMGIYSWHNPTKEEADLYSFRIILIPKK